MTKIRILIDTMILQHIHDKIGMNHFTRNLKAKNIDVEILLSWVNVFEKVKGIKEEYDFIKNQSIIKMASKEPNVCMLANPKAHIMMQFDSTQWETHAKIFKTMLDEFLYANNISNFMDKWGNWISKANADLERIKRDYDEMAEQIATLPKKVRKTSPENIYESLKLHLTENFSLPRTYIESNIWILFKDFPSIKYYTDLFIDFAIGIGKSIYRKDVGNYLDNQQVLYLNIADYFITNEKILLSRMRNLSSKALNERVFTYNEFIGLNASQICHCAPQDFPDYYTL